MLKDITVEMLEKQTKCTQRARIGALCEMSGDLRMWLVLDKKEWKFIEKIQKDINEYVEYLLNKEE